MTSPDLAARFSDDAVNMGRDFGLVEGYLIRTGADPRIIDALGRIAARFEGDDEEETPPADEPEDETPAPICEVPGCEHDAAFDVEGQGLFCQKHYDELDEEPENTCEKCGCTDSDCSGCIERTGMSCSWANEEKTICSACVEDPAAEPARRGRKKKDAEPEPAAKAAEEDRAWSQHRGEISEHDRTDQPEGDDQLQVSIPGLDPAIAERAEQVKAEQRRFRRWLPEEDALIKELRATKQKTAFITAELNKLSPDNQRTESAVTQRIFKLGC